MPLMENPMAYEIRLDKDYPKDSILFIPSHVKCEKCGYNTPIQRYCIKCGHEHSLTYLGKFIGRITGLIGPEVMNYTRSQP